MALSDVIARLAVSLSLETAAFEKGATLAEKRMEQSRKRFEKVGQKMAGIGRTMSVALTAPLALFGHSAVTAASDAAELQSAFDQTFGEMSATMHKWAEETGDAMGRSTQEMQKAANTFGIFFNTAVDPAKAAAMSQTFATLAQDLGSFYNVNTETAIEKLRSGLSGESEPLRDFGVFLTEANVKAKALELGLTGVGDELTEQEKILARYQLIMEATTNAQGDVARTSEGTANQMRRAKAAFEELHVAIGTKLLPVITPLIDRLAGLLDYFANLSDGVQTAIVAVGGLAAALGPLLIGIGSLVSFAAPMLAFGKALWALVAAQGSVAAGAGVLTAAFGSLLASIAPIALAVGAIYVAWKNWDDIAPRFAPLIRELRTVAEWLGVIGPKATEAGDATAEAASDLDDLATAASKVSIRFQSWVDAFDAYNARSAASARENGTTIQAGFAKIADGFTDMAERANALGRDIAIAFAKAVENAANLYRGVKTWLSDKLNAVWDWVVGKVETVKGAFFDLYDAVVGHSYIPDMVDGIAAEMARLDGVMVDPAANAARKTSDVMREMAAEVHALLDRLFPEIGRANAYRSDMALIAGSGLSQSDQAEARRRLGLETAGYDPASPVAIKTSQGPLGGDIGKGIDDFSRAMDKWAKRTGETTVRVAKSFKDMADDTLGALRQMTDAIKGGGFLDILESVIGLGLQLGSIGAFGSKVQASINRIPGNANGTNNWRGGLSWVGERGPELVNLPRGAQVLSNRDSMDFAGGGRRMEIVPSPYFDVVVDGRVLRAAPGIARGGAQLANQQATFARSRSIT